MYIKTFNFESIPVLLYNLNLDYSESDIVCLDVLFIVKKSELKVF
jgi:hypothetical protein